ncbi:MAG TPA: hypothetical protein VEQ59_08945, partial [Polyangiaceae bacterium]|nr:hypothetical protein [Polyangiaceae bacterium]
TLNDEESLAALEQLTSLDLTATLHDAAPLAGLTKLQSLLIGNNTIANLSALGSLVNLKTLNIGLTGASNIGFVSNFTKLTEFYAVTNDIVDVGPLGGLTQLNMVNLQNNKVVNLKPLADNPGIGTGDTVSLRFNSSLDCSAQAANIKAMTDRGATVDDDCP